MKMKLKTAAGIFVFLAVAAAGATQARAGLATEYGTFTANAKIMTDYRHRGISRSDNSPSAALGVEWTKDGMYAGVRSTLIDTGDSEEGHYEVTPYAGYKFSAENGITVNVGIDGYIYPFEIPDEHYQYVEGKIVFGYEFRYVKTKFGLYVSPDYYDNLGESIYPNFEFDAPIRETKASVIGSWGHLWLQDNDDFNDYTDWSLGLAYRWNGFRFEGKYIGSTISHALCTEHCGGTVVGSITKGF